MTYLLYTLNGLSYGMTLFILSAGLTLILGVMNILNLAHGAFYLLAFYVALSVALTTHNYLLAVLAGAVTAGLVGLLVQRFLLSRIPKQHTPPGVTHIWRYHHPGKPFPDHLGRRA